MRVVRKLVRFLKSVKPSDAIAAMLRHDTVKAIVQIMSILLREAKTYSGLSVYFALYTE